MLASISSRACLSCAALPPSFLTSRLLPPLPSTDLQGNLPGDLGARGARTFGLGGGGRQRLDARNDGCVVRADDKVTVCVDKLLQVRREVLDLCAEGPERRGRDGWGGAP